PVRNTNDQITRVDPTIKIPDWRSVSPKKRNTRPPHTSRTTVLIKPVISPVEASHSRGIARNSFTAPPPARTAVVRRSREQLPRGRGGLSRGLEARSLDHQDVRVGGEQRLGEHVVERADPEEGDHDRLVDCPADALGAARRGHALVAADDRDDRS